MEIRRYESGLLSSNMYMIIEDNHAIIIDPFEDTSAADGLIIDFILLTHEHYDHISGVKDWKVKTGAPVLCSQACSANIQNPKKNLAKHFKDFCEIQTWMEINEIPEVDQEYVCTADETFEEEMNLNWRGHVFKLVEIPGHSQGSIGIMLDGKDFFSGDSLMENSGIELRMPGGSVKKWETIGKKRIDSIPDGTKIWPGHFDGFIFHRSV